MTIKEMHYDFELRRDSVASGNKPNFLRPQIDWLLNTAMSKVIKSRLTQNNKSAAGVEANQRRVDDLKTLLVKYPDQPALVPTQHDGVLEIPLTSLKYTYMYFVRGAAKLKGCDRELPLVFRQHDDLAYHLADPFRSDIAFNFGKSSTEDSESSIYLYPKNIQVESVKLEYLKQPAKLNYGGYVYIDGSTYPEQSCELDQILHDEVVDKAIELSTDDQALSQLYAYRSAMNE